MSQIIEYPKALTLGDQVAIVDDAAGEEEARARGFRFWSDPPAAVESGEANQGAATAATDGETVESLRAKLDALGIDYHHRAGVDKLRALLPQ